MSLFDVIKYQVSDRPTLDQLNALPEEVVQTWIAQSYIFVASDSNCVIAQYFSLCHLCSDDISEVDRLKQTIRDYYEHI